jgi:hypothetical protein
VRRYHGFISDSGRWQNLELRPDDIIISAPSKCGTTWMQTIVGMLVFDRVELGAPMGLVSPWLDMLTRPADELYGLLDAQTHRRFIKTHTPLDGLPSRDTITYLTVVRHPLDAVLSDRDHRANMDRARMHDLRDRASPGLPDTGDPRVVTDEPTDDVDFLRWWVDNDLPPSGTGTTNLAEFAHQASTYWDARARPNVHLFHYADLCRDRDGEMRRVADALGIRVDEARWPELVAAAGFDAMRARARDLAPDAHLDLWRSDATFFHSGRSRAWEHVLGDDDVAHFERRLAGLAGPDVTTWLLR